MDIDAERKRITERVEWAMALVNDLWESGFRDQARHHYRFYLSQVRSEADRMASLASFLMTHFRDQETPDWSDAIAIQAQLWQEGVTKLEAYQSRLSN